MNHWNDNEQTLNRFREWLDETHAEADRLEAAAPDGGSIEPEAHRVGLYQVVEEFTALRHELKLETKSARNQHEQIDTMLSSLERAIAEFQSVKVKDADAVRDAARPMAERLVELDESLERGQKVIEDARRRVEETARGLRESLDAIYGSEPWWRRWACRRYYQNICEIWFRQTSERHHELFDSLLEGYGLIRNRLRRAFKEQKIQSIPTAGEMVDPHCMQVVEAVDDDGRPPGMVVEEVRRGYWWHGKVLRFAEVRAVKGLASETFDS